MKIFKSKSKVFLIVLLLVIQYSCSKEETYDDVPYNNLTGTLTFTPEFLGTYSSDQINLSGSGDINKDLNKNNIYVINTLLVGNYLNQNNTAKIDVQYWIYLYFDDTVQNLDDFKSINYFNSSDGNHITGEVKTDGYFSSPLWSGNSSDFIYSNYLENADNCYTKITISHTYDLNIKGRIHKTRYCDGNFEATFFGGQRGYWGGLKIKGSFTGFEIKNSFY